MIVLTERLQTIADNVLEGESVADIGTDHGYLPLYLWESKVSPRVIMADISKGSLNKAKENCERMFPNEKFDLRLGDGLEVLDKGEVDTVVMAGIGGLLAIEIMDWDISKTLSFKKLIIQPRSNLGSLLRYLYERSFEVEKLILTPENKRICEVLVVRVPDKYSSIKDSSGINDEEFDFPDLLIENANSFTLEYLENAKQTESNILNKILTGKGISINEVKGDKALEERTARINRLDVLINRYNNGE